MIKLKTLLTEDKIDKRIDDLIKQIESFPDSDVDADLFGPKNKKRIILPFFKYLKELLPTQPELRNRIRPEDLEGTPLEVYDILNYSKHAVRNFLILHSNGLKP